MRGDEMRRIGADQDVRFQEYPLLGRSESGDAAKQIDPLRHSLKHGGVVVSVTANERDSRSFHGDGEG
jgi:hypothetical protein